MHESSYIKVQSFVENYIDFSLAPLIKVLDVGSMIVVPGALTYRSIFEGNKVQYIGLDVAPGLNVDYVPGDPYSWSEIPDESIDVIVSGQAFEHVPYFWITAAEMSRVLKPNGFLCLVFPSSGAVHRYPFDCWRFYPDSAQALTQFTGLELIEADTEQSGFRKRFRNDWKETLVIAHKSASHDVATTMRLKSIVESRPLLEFNDLKVAGGPAIIQYENVVRVSLLAYGLRSLQRFVLSFWKHRIIPIIRKAVKVLIRYDKFKDRPLKKSWILARIQKKQNKPMESK